MPTSSEQPTVTIFDAGEKVPEIPNSLWLILSGVVKTSSTTYKGIPMTLGLWGRDDVVGKYLSNVKPYTIQCITTVEAVPISQFQWNQLTMSILAHAKQTKQLIYIVRSPRVDQSLWLLLRWVANKFGYVIESGILIDFQLTHQEMASLIGTTRITVTKILTRFEQEGLITRDRKRIIIHQ